MSLITYLSRIHFADGVLEDAIEAELDYQRIARPLVIADQALQGRAFERLLAALPEQVRPKVLDVPPSTGREEDLLAAAQLFATGRCDGIIGFGGATAIDLAKILSLTGADPAALTRRLDGAGAPVRMRAAGSPAIVIPTSAASGAGLSRCAGIVRSDGRRVTLIGAPMLPAAALCDPTLMGEEPREAVAAAGMDVIVHCIETYLCADWNPPADGIALEGLRRAASVLERAVADREDLEARRELLAAALNGALAEEKGLGGIHALAHALEETPTAAAARHGRFHAALAPHVLAFNAPAVGGRYRLIKQAMRLPAGADLPQAVADLGARLALPIHLGVAGVRRSTLDPVSRRAEADPTNRTNPRLATAGDYRAMLEAAF
jgi:alcohol dehydrogenase class IV